MLDGSQHSSKYKKGKIKIIIIHPANQYANYRRILINKVELDSHNTDNEESELSLDCTSFNFILSLPNA